MKVSDRGPRSHLWTCRLFDTPSLLSMDRVYFGFTLDMDSSSGDAYKVEAYVLEEIFSEWGDPPSMSEVDSKQQK